MTDINIPALIVFTALFAVVTVMGFRAARWRRAADPMRLDEWGLAGRRFGTWTTWFVLGGELYNAYTFVAIPALIFGAGAIGFYAVPYSLIAFPLVFIFMPRLWSVTSKHGYVTSADFVRGRFGSKALALAVAITGLVATMPFIAMQIIGIQMVLDVMGLGGGPGTHWLVKDAPLLIAFAVLAAYTYSSGMRAPALIAFVKDALVYLAFGVAVVYIPYKLGGFDVIFTAVEKHLSQPSPATGAPLGSLTIGPEMQWTYATFALGSAMAVCMSPHQITGMLSVGSRNVIRRNAALLPAYSLLLGLIALLGFMAVAAGVGESIAGNPQLAVPQLFENMFPAWFAGIAFAAIGLSALVPAAVMSIAAANLFTRNIYKEFFKQNATPAQETRVAKLVSLLIKFGALFFVLALGKNFAVNLQLLGAIWLLQTFPAVVFSLYTRWFHRWGLLAGWATGVSYGTLTAYGVPVPGKSGSHFGGAHEIIPIIGERGYIGLTALILNLIVAVVVTIVLRALKAPEGMDATSPADYYADKDESSAHPNAAPPVKDAMDVPIATQH
ncbi:monocarboxylate uptake permease MctP [Streptomyces sp. 7N604]|uniref:monocarboxylate uptake permease MctP n=1 Tax=Streptomyces sp. 7N604 TaxID=3457415 RepID=UPI003FD389D2